MIKYFIKKLLPRGLYWRTFLIVTIPLVFVQLVTAYVVYDRHLGSVTKTLSNLIGNEISLSASSAADISSDTDMIANSLDIKYKLHNHRTLPLFQPKLSLPWIDNYLIEALNERISFPFQVRTVNEVVRIAIELPNGIAEFQFPHKRLFSRATPLVFLGTLGSTILFMILALLFMRNQIRPIHRLAVAAERFGQGHPLKRFKPEGALEVRRASAAFIKMQERITKQLHQRAEMLAAISHDLCTPLTRMRLQVEMISSRKQDKEALIEEIQQMELLIAEYLDFVQGKNEEKIISVNLETFFQDLLKPFLRTGSTVEFIKQKGVGKTFKTRPFSLKRALSNFIQNSLKYGTQVLIVVGKQNKGLVISIQDNGPGVSKEEKKKIFRPFYRVDKSRNTETGGAGLGLSIARDIILSLGGRINLRDSSHLKGLEVRCYLPQDN